MSFGLLTAVEVDDIPRIMRRVAAGYRLAQTERHKRAWEVSADLLERYADELEPLIKEIKRSEPRYRVRLNDDEPVRRRRRRRERL
jgi:hypothetical protein